MPTDETQLEADLTQLRDLLGLPSDAPLRKCIEVVTNVFAYTLKLEMSLGEIDARIKSNARRLRELESQSDANESQTTQILKEVRSGNIVRENILENALRALLAWADGGQCNDCVTFRESPADINYTHEHDCGYLKVANAARKILDLPEQEGHSFKDPIGEMSRLARERAAAVAEERAK